MPIPANEVPLVLFAFLYEDLKTTGMEYFWPTFFTSSAVRNTSSRLSTTHGPAMRTRGPGAPMEKLPTGIMNDSVVERSRPVQHEACDSE
jgi:hypothetical protein